MSFGGTCSRRDSCYSPVCTLRSGSHAAAISQGNAPSLTVARSTDSNGRSKPAAGAGFPRNDSGGGTCQHVSSVMRDSEEGKPGGEISAKGTQPIRQHQGCCIMLDGPRIVASIKLDSSTYPTRWCPRVPSLRVLCHPAAVPRALCPGVPVQNGTGLAMVRTTCWCQTASRPRRFGTESAGEGAGGIFWSWADDGLRPPQSKWTAGVGAAAGRWERCVASGGQAHHPLVWRILILRGCCARIWCNSVKRPDSYVLPAILQ